MKYVVSVSLGSSLRNKSVETEIGGERIKIERIGTDGDKKKAAEILMELDGKVDAYGLGGCDLGMQVNNKYYPLHSVKDLAGYAIKTPLTDGAGLKNSLELRSAAFLEENLKEFLDKQGRHVLMVNAVSRWGMAKSFIDAGYSCTFGDFMFSLGIPLAVRSERGILLAASVLCPLVTRLPFSWIYPVGNAEEIHRPAYEKHYREASVIAGDCLYIKQSLPDGLAGKIIVTNTTTETDIDLFRKSGISYVITTTPVFDGRTFGTNVLEAVITALAGSKNRLNEEKLNQWIDKLKLKPQIRQLN